MWGAASSHGRDASRLTVATRITLIPCVFLVSVATRVATWVTIGISYLQGLSDCRVAYVAFEECAFKLKVCLKNADAVAALPHRD